MDRIAGFPAAGACLDTWLSDFVAQSGGISGSMHLFQRGGLTLVSALNIPDKVRQIVAWVPCGKGMAGLALERGVPIETCNLKEDDTGAVRPGAKAVDAKAAVAIPVRNSTGSVYAVVGIAFPDERRFAESELKTLTQRAATLPRP